MGKVKGRYHSTYECPERSKSSQYVKFNATVIYPEWKVYVSNGEATTRRKRQRKRIRLSIWIRNIQSYAAQLMEGRKQEPIKCKYITKIQALWGKKYSHVNDECFDLEINARFPLTYWKKGKCKWYQEVERSLTVDNQNLRPRFKHKISRKWESKKKRPATRERIRSAVIDSATTSSFWQEYDEHINLGSATKKIVTIPRVNTDTD